MEPNQPKGSGNYWLITKASVTNGPLHPIVRIVNLSHLLVSDITGHWQPIYTPDKESLNNNADEQSNKILNICGYYD